MPLHSLVVAGGTDLGMHLRPEAAFKWISHPVCCQRAKDPSVLSGRAATHVEAGLCRLCTHKQLLELSRNVYMVNP